MSKTLVAYFSASGVTATVAEKIASVTEANLFEIKPEVPYTKKDLNWMDKKSRSTLEMKDPSSRPAIAKECLQSLGSVEEYDVIYLGFPIWWYVAPTIINTFLESYDMAGKKIILFATSGSSGFGKTVEKLEGSCPGATLVEGKVLKKRVTLEKVKEWVEEVQG